MRKTTLLLRIILIVSLSGFIIPLHAQSTSIDDLLAPAPTQPVNYYDRFGELLSPKQAFFEVTRNGLNPFRRKSYQRLGMVHITPELIAWGGLIFTHEEIGDQFGVHRVGGTRDGLAIVLPDLITAIAKLEGKHTTNLEVALSQELKLGSQTFPEGTVIRTGLDVEAGTLLPIGLRPDGNITCALCHVTLDPASGKRLNGVPNNDIFVTLFVALAPNSSFGFSRLNINPFDPALQGNGKTIINSQGELVQLPDAEKLERAIDDFALSLPAGQFESSPDRINNTTQIPSVFTFRSGPYGFDGLSGIGPFSGLSNFNNAVHSSEINLTAAVQNSAELIGIDPEVYLGILLQNAADPTIRLPQGDPVQPSVWLRQVAPDPMKAELEDLVEAPGAGNYPMLRPSLFTFNGLIFSPETYSFDLAAGRFLAANNAMSAWQNNLTPPPNHGLQNQAAIASGSVARGAQVFADAGCAACHIPPFFTDNLIHPLAEIGTNPARARSRLALESLLVPPKLYTFNTPVPIPPDAETLDIPTEGFSPSPTSFPLGFAPDGGYKTTPLRGLAFSPPYLHDGGVAVREGSLTVHEDGSFTISDPSGLGMPGTLSQGINADAASSLRALVDSSLRGQVTATNKAFGPLVRANIDGSGHEFYVDAATGFTPAQQQDLINFLLALDDNPGEF